MEKAERNARETPCAVRDPKAYGSEKALFANTAHETILSEATAHLATWGYWHEDDGTEHRYAETLGGEREFYRVEKIPPLFVRRC